MHTIYCNVCAVILERRRLDLGRCEILPQVWDLLERLAAGDPRACCWREARGQLIVAPVDFSLRVVLHEGKEAFYLVSAYPQGRRKGKKMLERGIV